MPAGPSTRPTPIASSDTKAGAVGLRLHYRVVIPFAVAAAAAMSLSAYLTRRATEEAFRERIESQIVSAASLLAESGFALTPSVIGSVRAIADADVVTFTREGRVLTSTMDTRRAAQVAETLRGTIGQDLPGRPVVRRVPCDGECYAAVEIVRARPGMAVAVIARGTELAAATGGLTQTILAGAVVGLVLLLLVGQLVARWVTAPIERLVRFTQAAGEGDLAERAAEGRDEVGRLGSAFNGMLNRLAASREALVRNEKLALAGLFAARVAHDIRNPLSSIKMQTQLLQRRLAAGDDRTGASLAAISGDVLQVESVVRNLLEVARPGAVRRRPADLNTLVRDCLAQTGPRLSYRHIRQEVRLAEDLPALSLDADRLQQAILNVIHNAADAMTSRGVLRVETAAGATDVTLTIVDDGEGVPAEVLERIFDPFVTTKPDGVGLGLVNARDVVQQHGGTIALAPESPRGTRVTITLPLTSGKSA